MKNIYYELMKRIDPTWISFIAGISVTVIFTYFLSSENVPGFLLIITLCVLSLVGTILLSHFRSLRDKKLNQLNAEPVEPGEIRPTSKEMEEAAGDYTSVKKRRGYFAGLVLAFIPFITVILLVTFIRKDQVSLKDNLFSSKEEVNRLLGRVTSLHDSTQMFKEDKSHIEKLFLLTRDSLHVLRSSPCFKKCMGK